MRGWIMSGVVLVATSAAADQVRVTQLEKSATVDCAKDPHVSISNGMGTYTFKGACQRITVGGGVNTLTIESVAFLDIGGAKNTVTVDTVGTITVTGAMNSITWKKAKTGDKPTLKGQPNKNTIVQAK
jgi:hypothetical protein